ncbi:RNI-like protein [Annulohypoxylon bovei var. microspora]|nr:RNI-like protein [Annulohypoxylon bovei var. microspora]
MDPPRIQGPRSALTHYLASQNISAGDISRQHRNRVRAARAAAAAAANATTAQAPPPGTTTTTQDVGGEEEKEEKDVEKAISAAETRKRKRKEAREIFKIKQSKAYQKNCTGVEKDDEALALEMYQDHEDAKRATSDFFPGQTENCEICQQRFTVTPYSRAGPRGGLVCTKCGKKLADEEDSKKKGKKKASNGPGRRGRKGYRKKKLGGNAGVKSLVTLCIETLSANVHLADSLGDLPPKVIDRIARMLSKRRLVNSQTLDLFLQPQTDNVCVYDASQLSQQDYIRIFQVCTKLKHLKLYNAIQFRDDVVEYFMGRNTPLDSIYLAGANLVTESCWVKYLQTNGKNLKSLRVYFTDKHFNDNVVKALQASCSSLVRLKICHNQQVSDEGLRHIAKIRTLKHLSLHLGGYTTLAPYVRIIKNRGKNLNTLSLRMVHCADDELLGAIHDNCAQLSKLRITDSELMTDAAFVKLFTGWENKPLASIDLEKCRPLDSDDPRSNTKNIGFCSDGFRAMMNHSGSQLQKLNLHGCRHISQEAFEEVFSSEMGYPKLVDLEVSFCEGVTDFVVGLIFRSCPRLQKLNIFGCMKVNDVQVPRGKILVGAPTAQGMSIQGTGD